MFQWILEDYPFSEVESAFGEYINHKDDIPRPANIIEIIDKRRAIKLYDEWLAGAQQRMIDERRKEAEDKAEYEANRFTPEEFSKFAQEFRNLIKEEGE